jgi:hypothetical protein
MGHEKIPCSRSFLFPPARAVVAALRETVLARNNCRCTAIDNARRRPVAIRRADRRRRFSFRRLALARGPRLLRCHAGGRRGRLQPQHARELWLAWPLIAPRRCRRRVSALVLAVLPVPIRLGECPFQRLLVVLIVSAESDASHREHEDLSVRSSCSSVECIRVHEKKAE